MEEGNVYNWSNQCWEIHLLTTSALFPITSCLQTDYCCVCYCNCRADNWRAWAKAPNSHQLHWAMGKGCRWTNFTQRICEIFIWSPPHFLFILWNWSFVSYRLFFSSKLNKWNLLINSLITNIFYTWMNNHIRRKLNMKNSHHPSVYGGTNIHEWLIVKGCSKPEMFRIQGSVCNCRFSSFKKLLHGSLVWRRSSLRTDCIASWYTKCWNHQLIRPSYE